MCVMRKVMIANDWTSTYASIIYKIINPRFGSMSKLLAARLSPKNSASVHISQAV